MDRTLLADLLTAQEEESRRRLTHQPQAPNPYMQGIEDMVSNWWSGVQNRGRDIAGYFTDPGRSVREIGQLFDPEYMATRRKPTVEEGLEVALNFMPHGVALGTKGPNGPKPGDALKEWEQEEAARRARLYEEAQRPNPLAPTEEARRQELIAQLAPGDQAIMRGIDPNSPLFWEEYRALAAAQHQAAVRDELERLEKEGVLLFGTPAQQDRVETLFKGIAEDPNNFQFGGKPESTELADLVAHYSRPKNPLEMGQYDNEIKNTATGGRLLIHDMETPTPHTYGADAASEGIKDGGGKNMYQAAMSWVANTGKHLKPDPLGISPINKYRKVENALSNYLRHGKEGYIDLRDATTAENLKEMLVHSKNYVSNSIPELMDEFAFNGTAFRRADGSEIGKGELTQAIKKYDPNFGYGIGETSLKRALLTKWAMSATLEEVKAAAKKFKDPVLYALSGLAVGAGAQKNEQLGNLLAPEQD